MADIDQRNYVDKMYAGPDWKKRVANMPKEQIFAIYMRDKHKKEAELAAKKAANEAPIYNDTLF